MTRPETKARGGASQAKARHMSIAAAFIALLIFSSIAASESPAPRISLADYCNGSDELDDTACLASWFEAGRNAPDKMLFAPPGTYLYQETLTLYSRMHLECTSPNATVFKRAGGSGILFAAQQAVHNIIVKGCGFDVNGSHTDFLAIISVNPADVIPSSRIVVEGNRMYDSAILGQISSEQRQYILLLNCDGCRVEGNRLSEGGRIKVGRPGRNIVIRKNVVDNANDNAITVVDVGAGLSEDILVQSNEITRPKAIGIFFGADGEAQTNESLTLRNIRIVQNRILGDWTTACILGTLPSIARTVLLKENTCTKTGVAGAFQAGIVIKRTNDAAQRARKVEVEFNRVLASPAFDTTVAPLDMGGFLVMGAYEGLTVRRNAVVRVGPRAIYLHGVDAHDAKINHNVLTGGTLIIEGSVEGSTTPNTIVSSLPGVESHYTMSACALGAYAQAAKRWICSREGWASTVSRHGVKDTGSYPCEAPHSLTILSSTR
jgi:hypothetical protein